MIRAAAHGLTCTAVASLALRSQQLSCVGKRTQENIYSFFLLQTHSQEDQTEANKMGQNQDLLAVVSHLDVAVRMGPFLQDFWKSANSRKWHRLSGYFPEPGAFISLSGTERGGWKKRFSGAFPTLPVLCDLGGGVWAALHCVALSLFTVHKMWASHLCFPFTATVFIALVLAGTGTGLLFTKVIPGWRSLVWGDFFYFLLYFC